MEELKEIKRIAEKDHSLDTIGKTMLRLLPVQVILAGLSSVNAVVSGLFASNLIGEYAMSAVALYDPVNRMVTAVATMLTAGAAIVCGKYMGRNEREKMQGAFSLDMFLAFAFSIVFTVLVFVMGRFELSSILTKDPVVQPHMNGYLLGQAAGIVPLLLGIQLSTFLSLENRTRRTVIASIVFIALNIVFNYIFVKQMQLGTFGLSLASSLGQWAFFLVQLQFFFTESATLRFSRRNIDFGDTGVIIKTGIPGALSLGYQTIRGLICNNLVTSTVGSVGLSAFGTCNSFLSLIWALPFGMVAVTRMLMGVSVGEEDRKTLINIMRGMERKYLTMMSVIVVLLIVSAVPMTNLYYQDPSEPVYMMTVWGFRILPLCMPLSIICMHFVAYGSTMNKQVLVHALSILDGVVTVVLFTAILIKSMGINALYVANVINGIVTTIFIVLYAWYLNKRMPRNTEDLMVIPDDFGISQDECMDISVRSVEDVVKVSEEIRDFCAKRGLDNKTTYLAGLVMEEMAGNIVEHGFEKDNKKHTVDVRVVHKNDDVILRIRDDCVPFDPAARLKLTKPDDPTSNIGIRMMFAMADDIKYQSILGMNVLTIRV